MSPDNAPTEAVACRPAAKRTPPLHLGSVHAGNPLRPLEQAGAPQTP